MKELCTTISSTRGWASTELTHVVYTRHASGKVSLYVDGVFQGASPKVGTIHYDPFGGAAPTLADDGALTVGAMI